MKVTLLGAKKLEFKDDEGKNVKGTSLFFSYEDPDVTGVAVEKKFIGNPEVLAIDPFAFIGKKIDIEYGLKSKVLAVTAV